ncbi:MAG: uroporphyrinogen decarboxylase family protein [Candidatus Neomarinimicrobiota bacterium]
MAFRKEQTPRAPWVPFVGCHGAKLIGETAENYQKSGHLLAKGLKKAYALYRPDGLPVIFDLQLEAEVLGCDLHWADDAPPSVISHPLDSLNGKSTGDLPEFSPKKGRFPEIARAIEIIRQDFGKDLALYGLICGPFTLALHLLGNEIFLEMYDRPEKVSELLAFCSSIARQTADFYLQKGADIVAVVDPMTSQISPEHFRQFVTPALNPVFNHIRAAGGLSSLFVCGDVDRNLECMCETTCDNVSVDEQISLPKLRKLASQYGKSFGGNLKLTVALLMGSADDCRLEAIRNLDEGGDTGFILAPGCDIPFNVPEQNLQAVTEMIYDEYRREIARQTLAVREFNFDHIILPDYAKQKEVILDIITLDSASCAPCQYMVEAAVKAVSDLNIKTIIREHKIKSGEGVGMMQKLGVRSLPTICIDGQVKFISIIPDQPTLKAAILDAWQNKTREAK